VFILNQVLFDLRVFLLFYLFYSADNFFLYFCSPQPGFSRSWKQKLWIMNIIMEAALLCVKTYLIYQIVNVLQLTGLKQVLIAKLNPILNNIELDFFWDTSLAILECLLAILILWYPYILLKRKTVFIEACCSLLFL
jgi:hypothetical protein